MLERQFDALAQPLARLVDAADIVPADGRRLHHDLAHRRRLDALQRLLEILAGDREIVEHLGRDRPFLEVQLGHDPADRFDRRLADQGGEVGADEAVGLAGEAAQLDPFRQRHAAGVDAEDLAAAAFVGHADHDLAIEAARPAQRLVERLGPVGGGDDDQILARLEAVEQGQQLRDQPFLGLAGDLAALGRDRIDLVDEDDRRRPLRRLLEELAQPLFALAISGAHDFGAGDMEEIGVALVGDRAREPRLAGAGRAVEEDAARRIDAEPLENLGIAQRQLDHLAELVDGRCRCRPNRHR